MTTLVRLVSSIGLVLALASAAPALARSVHVQDDPDGSGAAALDGFAGGGNGGFAQAPDTGKYACTSFEAGQAVSDLNITNLHQAPGTDQLFRFTGRMNWQGDIMSVGVEVTKATCVVGNVVAPIGHRTPFWGRYINSYGG